MRRDIVQTTPRHDTKHARRWRTGEWRARNLVTLSVLCSLLSLGPSFNGTPFHSCWHRSPWQLRHSMYRWPRMSSTAFTVVSPQSRQIFRLTRSVFDNRAGEVPKTSQKIKNRAG